MCDTSVMRYFVQHFIRYFMRYFIRDFTQYFTWHFTQYLTWYFTRCFTILANTYKNTNKFNTRTKLTIRTNHSHTRKTWLNAYANRRCPTACIAQTAIGKSKVMHQSIVECSVSQNKADCSTCHCACACTMCRSCHCVCCMHAAAVSLSLRLCVCCTHSRTLSSPIRSHTTQLGQNQSHRGWGKERKWEREENKGCVCARDKNTSREHAS